MSYISNSSIQFAIELMNRIKQESERSVDGRIYIANLNNPIIYKSKLTKEGLRATMEHLLETGEIVRVDKHCIAFPTNVLPESSTPEDTLKQANMDALRTYKCDEMDTAYDNMSLLIEQQRLVTQLRKFFSTFYTGNDVLFRDYLGNLLTYYSCANGYNEGLDCLHTYNVEINFIHYLQNKLKYYDGTLTFVYSNLTNLEFIQDLLDILAVINE